MTISKTTNARAVLARAIFQAAGIDPAADFFTLTSSQVCTLLEFADAVGYRQPRNASGSRAWYYFARLVRDLRKGDA